MFMGAKVLTQGWTDPLPGSAATRPASYPSIWTDYCSNATSLSKLRQTEISYRRQTPFHKVQRSNQNDTFSYIKKIPAPAEPYLGKWEPPAMANSPLIIHPLSGDHVASLVKCWLPVYRRYFGKK
ncbi:unnamed protein product [Aspergillus oryzae]|uniref:Unnamed protein product n=1 Tax=Aspergillus oryzae TaxID=5062 RepID=A0AAN4YRI2_ASPOZ|nr:unnamed protein product [Aspergillus oryzae]GMF95624.1 unnamed protein product [Aspergillus oryzae]GMG11945.1 unnamed protein product [Aspergillus oryzae]GMG33474.1 unnamed protein product [Aspergillus oryzae]